MSCTFETLIFDLDDTLVVEEASAESAFLEAGELAWTRYGIDPSELHKTVRKTCRELWYSFQSHPYCKRVGISSWEGMWAEFLGDDTDLACLREWAPRYRAQSWNAALRIHGIDDPALAAELGELFQRLRRQKHVLYPDAIPVLERVSRGYRTGLLTNGAPDLQRRKIEGAGIAGYFDQILLAGEIGFGKPDPRAFSMLLLRLNSRPDRALMIGDRLETDVRGAQGAGIRTIWINRRGESRDSGIIPDWEIPTLAELLPILEL